MHDNRSHPLLEQVPLTVSPFVHLPRATTLPYRYKAMPSALPPSLLDEAAARASSSSGGGGNGGGNGASAASSSSKPPYVVSPASATAAHPDDILSSCRALRDHVARLQADADAELQQLEARIQARDLAEKRRVAPGWLDSEDRLLVPERQQQDSGAAGESGNGGNGNGRGGSSGSSVSASASASAFASRGHSQAVSEYSLAAGSDENSGISEMTAAVPEAAPATPYAGADLDRAFGGMQLR